MEIYIALIGLLLSFFFSGSEAAYTAFNKLRLEIWTRRGKKFTGYAHQFLKHPQQFFSTILVGNNAANTLTTTFATVFLIAYFDESVVWAFITLSILLLGEIIPKLLFRSLSDVIILQVLFLVRLFYLILKPAIISINYFVDLFLRILKVQHESVAKYFSREEFEILLKEGIATETIEKEEQDYIKNILNFSQAKAREAMVPRTEIVAAPDNMSWSGLHRLMAKSKKLRIPVYRDSLDNIIGIIFAFDIFDPLEDIRSVIKPVRHVPENKSCATLLQEFQRENISIAVVIDEFGGTAGIITINDLIEEVFGDFQRLDEIIPEAKALNDRTWLIDARIEIDELSKITGLEFPKGDYETFAGFLLDSTGRIPKVNEILYYNTYRVVIIKVDSKRIKQVRLIKEAEPM